MPFLHPSWNPDDQVTPESAGLAGTGTWGGWAGLQAGGGLAVNSRAGCDPLWAGMIRRADDPLGGRRRASPAHHPRGLLAPQIPEGLAAGEGGLRATAPEIPNLVST